MQRDFAAWLQEQLVERGWKPADLLRKAEQRGYRLNSAQLSRILTREQEGGIDSVIAIAGGLGIAREEVFRARGWLLQEPEKTVDPEQDPPRLVSLVREARALSDEVQEPLFDSWSASLALAKARPAVRVLDGERPTYTAREPRVYRAQRSAADLQIEVNGQPLANVLRGGILDGLEWGYIGAGTEALAYSILEDLMGEMPERDLAKNFQFEVISGLPRGGWTLTQAQIEAWLDWQEARNYERAEPAEALAFLAELGARPYPDDPLPQGLPADKIADWRYYMSQLPTSAPKARARAGQTLARIILSGATGEQLSAELEGWRGAQRARKAG